MKTEGLETDQHLRALIEANVVTLLALVSTLHGLDDQTYTKPSDIAQSPLGLHVRHILEFYQAFFVAKEDGFDTALCYDDRERNETLETSKEAAVDAAHRLIDNFNTQSFPEQEIEVLSVVAPNAPKVSLHSFTSRELFSLLDHAIHHMATIKMIAAADSIELDAGFGVAKSTQQYQQEPN